MKVLVTTLTLVLIGAAIVVMLPLITVGAAVVLTLGFVLLWLLPILMIADSDQTSGGEKLAWILAIVFLSWFAWILYFLLAPIKPKRRYERRTYEWD